MLGGDVPQRLHVTAVFLGVAGVLKLIADRGGQPGFGGAQLETTHAEYKRVLPRQTPLLLRREQPL